jgi:ABC-type microcin C transport system duplicated ATPase subunit YejF
VHDIDDWLQVVLEAIGPDRGATIGSVPCRPKLLLADDPTTALDASLQIQIALLPRELQRELGLAVIFVTRAIGIHGDRNALCGKIC